ncbi:lytic transglycosylase domain-containing protein [Actinomycetospora sp. TBRC 11914]|uniref:lytic transglycosylase domain-containing protein n=1 Tax=Actinomycetospora sp. TBRC 11914 TaxID=2729387 RepID=UPI001B7D57FD|nr:lytic transglycosylase domain-containing protein [Actinomycetospora sp. TBRC 11914]
MPDEDRQPPRGSAWTGPTAARPGAPRPAAHRVAPRPPRRRRVPLVVCALGVLVLLAGLGAAGPPAPVTAATALPPPDTSPTGATGRLPDAGVAPLPGLPDAGLQDAPLPGTATGSGLGIPETVLAAYRAAATTTDRDAPGCRLTWPLVAGIGKVESGHASGGAVDADGTTRRPILGPQLTGTGGNAAIRDTDGGALDHDATWDRAVGPTQFIPSSWRVYGADGNGDGRADPDNVYDAGLATARHLCSGGGDLAQAAARHDAVFRYNHSEGYVATVLRWADAYASGALPVPDSPGPGSGGASGGVPSSDDAVTLAALPSPRVPTTAGAPAAVAAPAPVPAAPPLVAAPGAPRPVPAPTPLSASTTPTTGTAVGAPHAALAPPAGLPSSTTSSSTTGSSTTGSLTTGSSTTGSSTTSSTTGSSTAGSSTAGSSTAPPAASAPKPGAVAPAPASTPSSSAVSPPPRPPHPASAATPPPSGTTASSTTSSSTTHPPSSTTTPTTTAATRCAALVPAVAEASGLAAGQLTAVSTAGPGTGRTTCTVRGPRGPVLVAVTGTPTPPTPPTGVSRTLAGGRTVLTVPVTSGLTPDRAAAVLTALAASWPSG